MYLIFNMSSITGITPVGLFPVMATSFRWITTINYSFQGNIIDSCNSDVNFINLQNNYDDLNFASGSSTTFRNESN